MGRRALGETRQGLALEQQVALDPQGAADEHALTAAGQVPGQAAAGNRHAVHQQRLPLKGEGAGPGKAMEGRGLRQGHRFPKGLLCRFGPGPWAHAHQPGGLVYQAHGKISDRFFMIPPAIMGLFMVYRWMWETPLATRSMIWSVA